MLCAKRRAYRKRGTPCWASGSEAVPGRQLGRPAVDQTGVDQTALARVPNQTARTERFSITLSIRP